MGKAVTTDRVNHVIQVNSDAFVGGLDKEHGFVIRVYSLREATVFKSWGEANDFIVDWKAPGHGLNPDNCLIRPILFARTRHGRIPRLTKKLPGESIL